MSRFLLEGLHCLLMGVTVVNDERQIQFPGQTDLAAKGISLDCTRGTVAKEVEASLADGHDLGLFGEGAKGLFSRIIVGPGIVWMDADAGVHLGVTLRSLHRLAAGLEMVADGHHQSDPSGRGPRQGLDPVGLELAHLDVGVRIDKHSADLGA